MVVVYGWKLNEELMFGDPKMAKWSTVDGPMNDGFRIQEALPFEELQANASREAHLGNVAQNKQQWSEAIVHYQRSVHALERFRQPEVLELASQCYLASGRCALADKKPALCLSLLRQHFLISEPTNKSIELKRVAKEYDTKMLQLMESLLRASSSTFDQVRHCVAYLVEEYPLQKRSTLAVKIVEQFRSHAGDSPDLLLDLARCYMAEGRWDEAHSLLDPLALDNEVIRQQLDSWRGMLSRGYGRWMPQFGAAPENCDLDVTDAVNRGLTFLVNGLYHDAREWLLFALEKGPHDPFALFGHALFLWQVGWFSLAAMRLHLAKEALAKYPTAFRFVLFNRMDEMCAARSYHFNPFYPIFNIGECLERVTSREPFVSFAIVP